MEVWYDFEATLEVKLPYRVAFETIKEWADIEGEVGLCRLRGPRHNIQCTTIMP